MHRTSSIYLEPHHCRDRNVCRVLSHEFRVVRLYRTFSNYIFTGETRCAVCSCTSSGWFKRIEPHHRRDSKVCRVLPQAFGVVRLYRTFSNYIFTGETRFAGCLCTSSEWFKRIEHLSRGNKVCTVAYALVRGGSTVPNLLYLNLYRGNKVCSVLMH